MTATDLVLSQLDAAYRLARWHARNEREAEAVVQEASLLAVRRVGSLAGGNARVWFLRIVSTICDQWRGSRSTALPFQSGDLSSIEQAIRGLPHRLREVLVLREVEGLSYEEVAEVMDVPVDTVLTSLSAARQALSGVLTSSSVAV